MAWTPTSPWAAFRSGCMPASGRALLSLSPSLGYCLADGEGALLRCFVFPEAKHQPSRLLKALIRVAIAFHVAQDFLRPVASVRLWWDVVLRASVPIATVNEDRHLYRTKDHVCCPAKIWQGMCRNAVTKTLSMDQPSDQLLGLCVTAADRLHVAAAGCGRRPGTLWRFPLGIFGHIAERSTGAEQEARGSCLSLGSDRRRLPQPREGRLPRPGWH